MKKIYLIFILLIGVSAISAQEEKINSTLQVFPYRQPGDVATLLKEMEQWDQGNWRQLIICLDEDKKTTAASYALSAYVNHVALQSDLRINTAKTYARGLDEVKTIAAKQFILKQLG
ncbi:MAG: hypothetical protein ACK53B_10805 [Bacteroidota bacterium]